MEFALVDGERRSPIKGQRGACQYCGGEMVSKCGRVKMWHWSHMPKNDCDPWWGPETEWHREWKNRFPADWREIVHNDGRTGERHIADVKTPHGLVIEFQHSPIEHCELVSRETFYQNMIWIVDGDRGSTDPGTFNVGFSSEPEDFRPLVHLVKWWGQSQLLRKWAEATAPVYIDFGRNGLWRFQHFWAEEDTGAFSPLDREWLVEACENGEPIPLAHIPKEEEEKYLSRPRMVEVGFNDQGFN